MIFIDHLLACSNRSLRTRPGKLLLGPTGRRLFADYLDKVPGFWGRIDFIHKLNLPGLFRLEAEGRERMMECAQSVWYPSHLHMSLAWGDLLFEEDKFITWEDVAVSCQHWSNRSNAPIVLRLYLPDELGFQNRTFTWEAPRHAFTLAGVLEANGAFEDSDRFILAPGESVRFVLAAAVDEISHAGHEQLRLRARKWLNCGNPLDAQESEYAAFFDDVPVFECSDPLYTTAYWYRWYILRNAYAQPQTGSFRHGLSMKDVRTRWSRMCSIPTGTSFPS